MVLMEGEYCERLGHARHVISTKRWLSWGWTVTSRSM